LPVVALALALLAQDCERKLVARDASPGDELGAAVALSAGRILAGAPDAEQPGGLERGATYVFERAGGAGGDWAQTRLEASDGADFDFFGAAVSISGDFALVGAFGVDLPAPPPGSSGAGDLAGAAYVFRRQGASWLETQKLVASDADELEFFGASVSLSGSFAVVGARGDADSRGAAYVFERVGTRWNETARLVARDGAPGHELGISVAIAGSRLVLGALGDDHAGFLSGSAHVFERVGTAWTQTAKLVASDARASQRFGEHVALSGRRIVVGAWGDDHAGFVSGAAYVFEKQGDAWIEVQKLVARDAAAGDVFGSAVAIVGDRILVGAKQTADLGTESRSAYLFERRGPRWVEVDELSASDGAPFQRFGRAVALDGRVAAVGSLDVGMAGALYAHDLRCRVGEVDAYCFCDADAPCGNEDPLAGCATSSGAGSLLFATGTASASRDDLTLFAVGVPPGEPGIFFMGSEAPRSPFGDGLRCVGAGSTGVFRYALQSAGPDGVLTLGPGIVAFSGARFPPAGRIAPGDTWLLQAWFGDPSGPCGFAFNLSNGLAVSFAP